MSADSVSIIIYIAKIYLYFYFKILIYCKDIRYIAGEGKGDNGEDNDHILEIYVHFGDQREG